MMLSLLSSALRSPTAPSVLRPSAASRTAVRALAVATPEPTSLPAELQERYAAIAAAQPQQDQNYAAWVGSDAVDGAALIAEAAAVGMSLDVGGGQIAYAADFDAKRVPLSFDLIYCRHGKTTGNTEPRVYQGYVDEPQNALNDIGLGQAQDAADQLDAAADILLDLEPDVLELEEDARSVMGSAMGSVFGSVMGSQAGSVKGSSVHGSLMGSLSGSVHNGGHSARSAKKRGARPRLSSVDAKHTQRSGSRATARSRNTSRSEERQEAPTEASSEDIQTPEAMSIKHLVQLVRIYTILAMMAPTMARRQRTSLVAQHYVLRIWDQCFATANEPPPPATDASLAPKAPKAPGAPQAAAAAAGAGEAAAKAAGGLAFEAPQEMADWLDWDLAAQTELRTALQEPSKNLAGMINSSTITAPTMLLHYLDTLVATLQDGAYHLQALPVLALVEIIAKDVLVSPPLASLVDLRFARLFDALGAQAQSVARLKAAEPILPTPAEFVTMREEVEQREQLMLLAAKNTPRDLAVAAASGRKKVVSARVELRQVWLDTARILLDLGRLSAAKVLLAEARRHAVAFDDSLALGTCRRLSSRLARWEGAHAVAVQSEYLAASDGGDPDFWVESVQSLVDYLGLSHRKNNSTFQDLRTAQLGVLRQACAVFEQLAQDPAKASMLTEARRNLGVLLRLRASVLLRERYERRLQLPRLGQGSAGYDAQTQSYGPALALLTRATVLFDELEDSQHLIASLREAACARVDLALYTHQAVHIPSLLSLTPAAEPSAQLQIAAQLLQRAETASQAVLAAVRPPVLAAAIELPCARTHAEVKLELGQVCLLLHRQTRPLRVYRPLRDAAAARAQSREQRDFLSSLDLAQQAILNQIPAQDQDQAINSMFFAKYDGVFGNEQGLARTTSAADRALVLFTSALCLSGRPGAAARAHLGLGTSLAEIVLLRRETREDEDRKQASRQAASGPPAAAAPETEAAVVAGEGQEEGAKEGAKAEAAAVEEKAIPALDPVLGVLGVLGGADYSFDSGMWSPRWLVSAIKQQVQSSESAPADPKAAKGAKGKAAPPAKGKAAAAAAAAVPEVVVKAEKKDAPAPDDPLVARLRPKALHHLYQAIEAGRRQDDAGVVSQACLQVAMMSGTTQPQLTAQMIAMSLSGEIRRYGLKLFAEAASNKCGESLILDRRAQLEATCSHPSREKASINQYLDKGSVTSRRLSLSAQGDRETKEGESFAEAMTAEYELILSTLPPALALLHLLWDKEASALVVSLVLTGGAGGAAAMPTYVGRHVLAPGQAAELVGLEAKWARLRAQMRNRILVYGATDSKYLDEIQAGYDATVAQLAALLSPGFERALVVPGLLKGRDVMLLSDQALFEFPLEALPLFQGAASVCRDFSLHLLHQRVRAEETGAKPGNSIGYITDPYQQDHTGTMTADYDYVQGQCTSFPFKGVQGSDTVPVQGQWQRVLCESSVFAYYGFERYLAQLTAPSLAGMNCERVRLVVLHDRATNETSHRRQSKRDNKMRPLEKEIENVYNAALLLSVRGVRTVVCHKHAISADVNSAGHRTLWAGLAGNASVGQAVDRWRRLAAWSPEPAEDAEGLVKKKVAGAKKGKKTDKAAAADEAAAAEASQERPAVAPIAFEDGGHNKFVRMYDKFNVTIIGLPSLTIS